MTENEESSQLRTLPSLPRNIPIPQLFAAPISQIARAYYSTSLDLAANSSQQDNENNAAPTPTRSELSPNPTQPTRGTPQGRVVRPYAQEREHTAPRRPGTRRGRLNYSVTDIDTLLDIVESVEPLGMQMWCNVHHKFDEWARENERPKRDMESLKHKFDKLVNTNKPTGDPSCPYYIRRAKRISRSILSKAAAHSIGGGIDDLEDSNDNDDDMDRNLSSERRGRAGGSVGARIDRRHPGAAGVTVTQQSDTLTECVKEIVSNISSLSTALVNSSSDHEVVTKEYVREEILKMENNTAVAIEDLKQVVLSLVAR